MEYKTKQKKSTTNLTRNKHTDTENRVQLTLEQHEFELRGSTYS